MNNVVYDWFCVARNKNIRISGPLLQQKALEVSEESKLPNFKASNGWLEKFRSRYNICFKTICGESEDVDLNIVDERSQRLESLCEGYEPKNIFNFDETGLFFKVLPNKTLCLKTETCASGKRSKEKLTVALCVNMIGEFEKPLVIGKSKKPRCFKNIDTMYSYISKNKIHLL